MPGRTLPILVSAIAGVALGAVVTAVLTGGPADRRGELPPPPPAAPVAAQVPRPPAAPAEPPEPEIAAARQALAARLRSPDALRLDEVRVWQFGPADERAVCGTMLSPEIPGGRARFVVRVLQPRGRAEAGARPAQTVVEDAPWLVRPSPEAARRFCREPDPEPAAMAAARSASGSGAAAAPVPAESPARTLPAPAESPARTLPAPAEGTARTASASVPAAAPPASDVPRGRVVTHSPANLRAAPSGEVLGTVPRGRSLTVFDRAPGGWVRVGDTAPEGWIHSSLLSEAVPN